MTAATFDTPRCPSLPARRAATSASRSATPPRRASRPTASQPLPSALSSWPIMLGTIVTKGYTAFWQTNVTLPVDLRSVGH
jgi:hypothetical protein